MCCHRAPVPGQSWKSMHFSLLPPPVRGARMEDRRTPRLASATARFGVLQLSLRDINNINRMNDVDRNP